MASNFLSTAAFTTLFSIAIQILLFAPNSSSARNILNAAETLLAGDKLSNGEYHLAMQHNCNLELYHGKNLTWESHTTGKGTKCFLYLQVSGELAIFSEGTSNFIWLTGTGGGSFNNFALVLQPDGNAVVYSNKLWSTSTTRPIDGNASSNETVKDIP